MKQIRQGEKEMNKSIEKDGDAETYTADDIHSQNKEKHDKEKKQ